MSLLQDYRILILLGLFRVWIDKRKRMMMKMNQISETHPALERIKGVVTNLWNLPEVVLISPGRRFWGRKPLTVKTSITKTSPVEEKIPVLTGHRIR